MHIVDLPTSTPWTFLLSGIPAILYYSNTRYEVPGKHIYNKKDSTRIMGCSNPTDIPPHVHHGCSYITSVYSRYSHECTVHVPTVGYPCL